MKQILTLLLIAIFFSTTAQTLKVGATRFIGGDVNCHANGYQGDIANTTDGGIVFAGITTCWDGEWEIPPSWHDFGSLLGNIIVGKLDANLNVQWIKVYGGTAYDVAKSIVQLSDGGYAVLSTTYSNNHDVSGNHGTGDLWLIRLDANGNLLWQKCYGSFYDEQAISVALTPDNGFIMLGVSNGMGDDVPVHYSGSEFDYDWFVVKTDDTGGVQWTKSIGGLQDEEFSGKILAANGGYYLVSSSDSHDHDCIDTSWHPGITNSSDDYYIFRLDNYGNILWGKSYGGSSSDRVWNATWDERDESINIVGTSYSQDYMVSGHIGDGDVWAMKADKNGFFKWGKCLGSINYEEGHGICTMPDGYCISGITEHGTIGDDDNWLFALDISGNVITDKQFGGAKFDFSSSAVAFDNNSLAIVGGSISAGFSEGQNLGQLYDPMQDIFISKVVFWPLGIQNTIQETEGIIVSPNPSLGNVVHIKLLESQQGVLHIYNIFGKPIYTFINTEGKNEIMVDFSIWAKGLYMVNYVTENGHVFKAKVINS